MPRDLDHKPQMAGDEPMRRVTVGVLTPALGQHVFFLAPQHREPLDLFKIMGEAGFGRKSRGSRDTGHAKPYSFRNEIIGSRPIVKLISKHYYIFDEAIMSARETAELLLLLGRLVQTEGYDGQLSPAQWMALRFFARANSFSRTPSAFAEFQATTRGTASQAIKALEAGGYLLRQRSR